MELAPYLVQSAVWSGEGAARRTDDPTETGKVTWTQIQADDVAATTALLVNFGFPDLWIEDALSLSERPSVQQTSDLLFLVVPVVHVNGPDKYESFAEVALFVSEHRLVSVKLHACPLFEAWFNKWIEAPERYGETAVDLAHTLLDSAVDGYFPAVDALEDVVEGLEARIYGGERTVIRDALKVKRRLLELRRKLSPLRDVINSLLRRDVTMIPSELKPYFQDLYDHTIRISESVDTTRDILSSVLDAHLSIISNNLSETMKKMTVISTLLMTSALVAGIYGMNFKFMPELDWRFGYPLALVVMLALCAIELWYFRRQKWI